MAPRRPFRCSLLLICLLILTGCGAPSDAGAQGAGQASASASAPAAVPSAASASAAASPDPRPTPASSRGPARNVPPPALPEVAKQNTAEGFEAFTQYWFDVATYAFEASSGNELRHISASDCKVCSAYATDIDRIADAAGWAQGPAWNISGFKSNMIRDPLGQVIGYFILDESPSYVFSAEGEPRSSRKGGNSGNAKAAYASFHDGRWVMRQLGQA
ncbi:DUF6318 family protein [Sinomonas humi]|uniref:DUF6318 family protein n=1 Tax=Sinomonas humi TaxID=1338436 RepID=UPI0026AD405D